MELKTRKNHRLKGYNYSICGYYYITICVNKMNCLLCDIKQSTQENIEQENSLRGIFNNPLILAGSTRTFATVTPTIMGKLVTESFYNIEKLNTNIKIDKFALMPNHIHAIIVIEKSDICFNTQKEYDFQVDRKSIQGLIRDFKSVTTRKY
ncbi:MAG: hypothetical protein IJZ35_05355 [Clostridia bacterium]|nr:hypothetical protein [Clostridia bacterium]